MNKLTTLFWAIGLAFGLGLSAQAQDAFDNSAASYRITNCKPAFDGKAIYYIASTTGLNPLVRIGLADVDMDAKQQLWTLIRADGDDPTAYYLRSTSALRYVGPGVSIYAKGSNKYNLLTVANSKAQGGVWNIVPLGDGQYSLSCVDDYGVRRYLNAADTTAVPPSLTANTLKLFMKNSAFAWRLTPSDQDPTGVPSVTSEAVQVNVLDGRIIVAGTDHYQVRDALGRRYAKTARLGRGVYIVTTPERAYKVYVK